MPDITWDDAFEGSPADTDEARYGASKIRDLKVAIRERLELEMNFKAGTQPLLKAGKAAVCFYGTTAEINALTGMSVGALAWDSTTNQLKRWNGASWEVLAVKDHGELLGLGDDDHTQYLHLNKAGQTLQQNLAVSDGVTIDGRDISADGADLDNLKTQPFVKTLAKSTSIVMVDQANVEVTLFSWTVPGGTLGTNKALRLTLIGRCMLGTTWPLVEIRVKYGSAVVLGYAPSQEAAGATIRPFSIVAHIAAMGAANSQFIHFNAWNGLIEDSAPTEYGGQGIASVDSSLNQGLIVTLKTNQGGANHWYEKRYAVLELIP